MWLNLFCQIFTGKNYFCHPVFFQGKKTFFFHQPAKTCQPFKHVFPVNLAQICSAVPEISDSQTIKTNKKVTDSDKNRTLCSSLHEVLTFMAKSENEY